MQADIVTNKQSNSIFPLILNGFLLFVSEFGLVLRLVDGGVLNHSLWNYALPLFLVGPLIAGLGLRRRLMRMRVTGDVSPEAFQTIDKDTNGLVTIAYLVLMMFVHFR